MNGEREIMTGGEYLPKGDARQRTNRTALTTVLGGVGFLDYPQADADSTTIPKGIENVVAVSTARIAQRPKLVVCAEAGCVDNAVGKFLAGEEFITDVLVESTTDIAVGDWLKPVNAQVYLVKATKFTVDESGAATDALIPVYAQALEARTTNDTGTIKCVVYSRGLIW